MLSTGTSLAQQALRVFGVRDGDVDVGQCDIPVDDFLALVPLPNLPSPFTSPYSELLSLLVIDFAMSVTSSSHIHRPLPPQNHVSNDCRLAGDNPTAQVRLEWPSNKWDCRHLTHLTFRSTGILSLPGERSFSSPSHHSPLHPRLSKKRRAPAKATVLRILPTGTSA